MARQCSDCKFGIPIGSRVVCRRYPPQVLQWDGNLGDASQGYWPEIDQEDWCGEFQSAPTPPDKLRG